MSDDKRYNGWSNYETWVVKLWMDNDERSYHYWQEQAQEAWNEAKADSVFTREENAKLELAKMLKSEHEENTPETVGVYADLLNAALSEVNWHEIAQALIDDEVDKSEEEVA